MLLPLMALPVFGAKRISIEKLEQIVASSHDLPDAKMAEQLSYLELSERLSGEKFAPIRAQLHGVASLRALVALTDRSEFEKPPAAEIPAKPPLDAEAQKKLLAQAMDYAQRTISKLPNFLATRHSSLFEDKPGERFGTNVRSAEPLHYIDSSTASVVYRGGSEKHDSEAEKREASANTAGDLASSGQFGPVLAKVLADASEGKVEWSHWELVNSNVRAIFRYTVPQKKSHYNVQLVLPWYTGNVVKEEPGYHGEIAIDPADGTVLRLTILAEMKPSNPMNRADMMVEYGPVEIGGKDYVCPLRSVTVVVAQTDPYAKTPIVAEFGDTMKTWRPEDRGKEDQSLQMLMNDVAFDQFHIFRSDATVLVGEQPAPDGKTR
ncbi:MAG TPA: hypothetical protein VHZ52_15580 [Acidobacteriaceae bacterium]|nr:hypothetical protein [Acidobacteriaceae bacterium]